MKKKLGVFFCQPIRSSLNNSKIKNEKKKKKQKREQMKQYPEEHQNFSRSLIRVDCSEKLLRM